MQARHERYPHYTFKYRQVSQSIGQLWWWIECFEHWNSHQDQRYGWGFYHPHFDQMRQWKETGYCPPEKDWKETCISTEVSLVQPRKDGDLRTTENTCSVLCFDLKDSMKGLGCNEDSLRLFAQGPTRSYRKLTESTRKCTKLIWRRTLFLKHLVTAASSQLPL